MTPDQAARVFAEIAVRTNGWDEPSSEAWMRDIGRFEHHDLALQAARQLVDNHTDHGRPQWGTYRALYLSELGRTQTARPALSASHESVLLPDYLDRLKARVASGERHPKTPDTEPATELENWRRLAHASVSSLIPTDWQDALREDRP